MEKQLKVYVKELIKVAIYTDNLYIRITFPQSEDGAKRLRLSDSSAASAAAVPVTKLGGIRRSTRHRKLRGEKALIVSANQTLKELKIQVRATNYWMQ